MADYRQVLNHQKKAATESIGPVIKLHNPNAGTIKVPGGEYSNTVTEGVSPNSNTH